MSTAIAQDIMSAAAKLEEAADLGRWGRYGDTREGVMQALVELDRQYARMEQKDPSGKTSYTPYRLTQ